MITINFYFSFCSSVPENKDFHKPSVHDDSPFLYCVLSQIDERQLSCPPAIQLITSSVTDKLQRSLIKGDSEGHITLWTVPDIDLNAIKDIEMVKKAPNGNHFILNC